MRYGLPYMGSKSRICGWLMDHLPPAKHFIDLFAGGCAVTHAALVSGHYEHVHANDIRRDVLDLFLRIVEHGLNVDDWAPVTRDEFFLRAPADALVRLVWSFGNKGLDYIYAREVEDVKLAAHAMLTAPELNDRLAAYRRFIGLLPGLFRDDRLVSLERLQSIESLRSITRSLAHSLTHSYLSFDEVEIPPDATVYADPPYADTKEYLNTPFDHGRFFDWLRHTPFPVYVSEYAMPPDFEIVAETRLQCSLCATASNAVTERLFLYRRFYHPQIQPDLF